MTSIDSLKSRRLALIGQRLRAAEQAATGRYFAQSNGRAAMVESLYARELCRVEAELTLLDPNWNQAARRGENAAVVFAALAGTAIATWVFGPLALVAAGAVAVHAYRNR